MNAIESVGRPTLLIKGTEILGTVTISGMRGNEFASINLTEELYAKHVAPLLGRQAEPVGSYPVHKLTFFRFSPYSGLYLDSNLDTSAERDVVDEWFDDVRVVDEFYFHYGMVPAIFKDVAGYGDRLAGDVKAAM